MAWLRHVWRRYLQLFVTEVRRPDGSTYLVSIDPSGLSDCWLPIEVCTSSPPDVPANV
jgi:hypothetical protein